MTLIAHLSGHWSEARLCSKRDFGFLCVGRASELASLSYLSLAPDYLSILRVCAEKTQHTLELWMEVIVLIWGAMGRLLPGAALPSIHPAYVACC